MERSVYEMLDLMFGPDSGLLSTTVKWIEMIAKALSDCIDSYIVGSEVVAYLQTIACTLLLFFYFKNLLEMAKSDHLSMDMLIGALVKLVIAVGVLLYLPELLQYAAKLSVIFLQELKAKVAVDSAESITIFGKNWPAYDEEMEESIADALGLTGFFMSRLIGNISIFITTTIVNLMASIASLVCIVVLIGHSIDFARMAIMSPIAVAQISDESSRHYAISYIKGLFAKALTFGIVFLTMYVASKIQYNLMGQMMSSSGFSNDINAENIYLFVHLKSVIPYLAVSVSAIGAISTASSLADRVVGV